VEGASLSTTPSSSPVVGEQLEHVKRYDVLRQIGEGGMGRIYQAYDPVLRRPVALKVMKDGLPQAQRERFRREAMYGARFCHPSIARIYDMGNFDGGNEWFSMEYLPGTDMDEVVDRGRTRGTTAPLLSIIDVFRQVLAALQYAHDCKVVHRDVKPANVMVTRDPNTGFVTTKLLDFGVSIDLDGPARSETTIVGDPRYMAPEQTELGRHLGPAVDIYATGISLYEVATGRHPFEELFEGDLRTLVAAHRDREVPPPSQFLNRTRAARVREGLDAIVARACAKRPGDRYVCARDMQRDLLALRASDLG
jgi:serine/threonine protein kinase